MWTFLAKLDPNAVLAVAAAIGAYVYQRIKPAGKPRYFSQATLLAFARAAFNAAEVLLPHGTTDALRAYALAKVRAELARVGQALSPTWETALAAELATLTRELVP